jgi:hypothetical protein
MMREQSNGLAKWHKFVSEKDTQSLSEALADDVLFRSPVIWKPKDDKASAMLYLSSAARVLGGFLPITASSLAIMLSSSNSAHA